MKTPFRTSTPPRPAPATPAPLPAPDAPVPTLARPPETVRVWDNSSGQWKDMANPIKRTAA